MTTAKTPRGYVGEGHETSGSDILAVLKACPEPWRILGRELFDKLAAFDPKGWYPVEAFLEPIDLMAQALGSSGLRQMGRAVVRLSHEPSIRRNMQSAGDVLFGMDRLYHNVNRGQEIGNWRMVEFKPGFARVEKNTPQHCWMAEGILLEAFAVLGVPATVTQPTCFRRGADVCVFELTSFETGAAWMGSYAEVG